MKREPLRRFEDIAADAHSVSIIEEQAADDNEVALLIVHAIREICDEHPTVNPDDIGVILVDGGSRIYKLSDIIAQIIPREIGWPVNKAVETKIKQSEHIFLSNRNNVKGLEFPFVICVTGGLNRSYAYRNSLYMSLTRSFLKSYLIITTRQDAGMMGKITDGLRVINEKGFIEAQPPTFEERADIMTTITQANIRTSFYDFCEGIFNELNVLPIFRQELRKVVTATCGEEFDHYEVTDVARFNYEKMLRRERV